MTARGCMGWIVLVSLALWAELVAVGRLLAALVSSER
jgi:hypothetical protein